MWHRDRSQHTLEEFGLEKESPLGDLLRDLSRRIIDQIMTRCSCRKRQGASTDKLQVQAAKIQPLVRLANSKQD